MISDAQFMAFTQRFDIIDVVVPVLLLFALVYAILLKIKLFHKGANVAVSFVMALTAVVPHVMGWYPPCWDVIVIMNNSMSQIGMMLIAIAIAIMILGLLGRGLDFIGKFLGWIAIGAFAFVTYTFITSRGEGCGLFKTTAFAIPYINWIFPILAFILVAWLVTRKGGESEDMDMY